MEGGKGRGVESAQPFVESGGSNSGCATLAPAVMGGGLFYFGVFEALFCFEILAQITGHLGIFDGFKGVFGRVGDIFFNVFF